MVMYEMFSYSLLAIVHGAAANDPAAAAVAYAKVRSGPSLLWILDRHPQAVVAPKIRIRSEHVLAISLHTFSMP